MKAFGIFEGGGAKGLAHVGAVKEAEVRGIKFEAVAGASAGSIVAALIAAEYTADQLFDIHSNLRNKVFDLDYTSLLDEDLWKRTKKLLDRVKVIMSGHKTLSRRGACWLYVRNRWFFKLILKEHGIFETHQFQGWLEQQLQKNLKPRSGDEFIRFRDLSIPTCIVATDLRSKQIKVFGSKETPTFPVSRAVAASIAIPFVFKPVYVDGMMLVDGGVLSNFPAWVFDELRRQTRDILPTFGFRLINADADEEHAKLDGVGFMKFMDSMFATIFSGDSILETREIEDLNLIPVKVSGSSLDFDIDYQRKKQMYLEGKDSAEIFFRGYIGPRNPEDIRMLLKDVRREIKEILGPEDIHLRMNVAMPVEPKRNRLRILYCYNMSRDNDDRLTFQIEEGAIGKCWTDHEILIVDLLEAKSTFEIQWRMSKYQQALIRPTLKSLICVPIFEPEYFDVKKLWKDNPILGVLSMDSDDSRLREVMVKGDNESQDIRQQLIDASSKIALKIKGL